MFELKFTIILYERTCNKLPKEESEVIKQNLWRIVGGGYFYKLGKDKVRLRVGNVYRIIHTRFKKSTPTLPNKYFFDINKNSLDSDYELLICGNEDVYYLVPTLILKEIYNYPTRYLDNNSNGATCIYTVDISTNKISFAKKAFADFSEYRNAFFK